MKHIRRLAQARGLEVQIRQGRSHTVVRVGDRQTSVPRHKEINELTARAIIKYLEEG